MSVLTLKFNGETLEKHDVYLYDIPEIESSNEGYSDTAVSGRLGSILVTNGSIPNIKINCVIGINSSDFGSIARDLKSWLKGTGELSITGDSYYKVLYVERDNIENEIRKFGTFEVSFICTPFEFANSGKELITPGSTLNNPYALARPEYHITGEGMCALTVNGNAMQINVGQRVVIDTFNMMAYKDSEEINTTVSGDYEDLYLFPGNNTISISEGFTLQIKPNWGWET